MSTKQSSTVGVAGSTTTDHPPAGSKKFSSQSGGKDGISVHTGMPYVSLCFYR